MTYRLPVPEKESYLPFWQDSFCTFVSNPSPDPAHLARGVCQVTALLKKPLVLPASKIHWVPSHAHGLLFLHLAVVLHPITNRNAGKTKTSLSYTAQTIVFHTVSTQFCSRWQTQFLPPCSQHTSNACFVSHQLLTLLHCGCEG